MSFFDGFKRLFGEGKFRIEGETTDDRKFTGKMPYIGSPDSELEMIQMMANNMWVDEGLKVKWMKIIGWTGTGIKFEPTGQQFTASEIYGD